MLKDLGDNQIQVFYQINSTSRWKQMNQPNVT